MEFNSDPRCLCVWVREPCCLCKEEGLVGLIGSAIRLRTAVCNINQILSLLAERVYASAEVALPVLGVSRRMTRSWVLAAAGGGGEKGTPGEGVTHPKPSNIAIPVFAHGVAVTGQVRQDAFDRDEFWKDWKDALEDGMVVLEATGLGAAGNLTGPSVAPRQQQ